MGKSMNGHDVAFQEMNIMVGTQCVNARTAGEGRPIVLFHSLLADNTSFDPIAGPLSAGHQVVLLNLPGFGGSDPVEGGLEKIADRIAGAVRQMGFKQAPIFLGNGYGGFIALLTAILHPGIAERLVLADCGAAFSEPGRAAFRGMSAAAKEKGLAGVADVAMRRLFSPEFQAGHPALIEERRQRFVTVNPQTFHNACAALATLDLRRQVSAVKTPVLVLVGEFDEATPPPMSHELAALLPNAKLKVLPGCAHVPQLQEPELFLSSIREFIGSARTAHT
jgi:3-oxoadipate enol-lactonase